MEPFSKAAARLLPFKRVPRNPGNLLTKRKQETILQKPSVQTFAVFKDFGGIHTCGV
jgi:hypothetical protein